MKCFTWQTISDNRVKIFKLQRLLWIVVFLFPLETSANNALITVFTKAEIENNEILLGNIAKIESASPEIVRKLRNIVIGSAPLPNQSRKIDKQRICVRLKQNGFDLSQITLHVPESCEVFRDFIEISENNIKKVFVDFVYGNITWKKNKTKIKNIQISDKVIIPKGSITYKIVASENMKFLGMTSLSILFSVNGKFQKKVWVTGNIEVLTDVVVTTKPIGRYKPITNDDICIQTKDLSELQSNVITSYEEALGKRAKRTINANVILRTDLIEAPPLVKYGDIVSIIAESGSLKVTALGKVKQKGFRGDRIKVINIDSKKVIYARVLDSNTVEVDF